MPKAVIAAPTAERGRAYGDALKPLGLETVLVFDGDAALAAVRGVADVTLLVTELSLPKRDGFSLIRAVRASVGREQLQVIVVSAFEDMLRATVPLRGELGIAAALPADGAEQRLTELARDVLADRPTAWVQRPLRPKHDEAARLAHLDALGIAAEASLDADLQALVSEAAKKFNVPVALVSLVLSEKQWWKAHVGLSGKLLADRGTPRAWAFCDHVVRAEERMVVPDARAHPVFGDNPLVLDGSVRGYAGAPLVTPDGYTLGTLCLIDDQPLSLEAKQVDALGKMARRVAASIHLKYGALSRYKTPLLISQADLRAVLDEMPVAVLLINPDRRLSFANSLLAEMCGTSTDLVAQMTPLDWVKATAALFDDPTAYLDMVRHLPTEPYVERRDFQVQRPTRRVVRWIATPVQLSDGIGQLFIYLDITSDVDLAAERAQLEDQVRKSEETYRTLVGNLPNGTVAIFDREMRFLVVDGDTVAGGYDRTGKRLVGRTLRESGLVTEIDRAEALFEAALRGERQHTRVRRDDRVVDLHAAPIYDSDGRITTGIAVAYDVTHMHEIEEQLRKQSLIASIQAGVAVAANEAVDLADALKTCINLVCSHTGWALGHAYLPAPGDPDVMLPSGIWNVTAWDEHLAFRQDTSRTSFGVGVGLIGRVLREKKAIWLDDLTSDEFGRQRSATKSDLRCALAAPVLTGGEVVAVLEFYSLEKESFDAGFVDLIAYTGIQLGRVMDRVRARDALQQEAARAQQLSIVDELTGLYNRRGFLSLAGKRLEAAHHEKQRAFLLFADLDGMKRINDELGHEFGDVALVEAAGVLRSTLRTTDIIARLGGDEFVAMAVETGKFDEAALVERLEAAVAEVNTTGERHFNLAISFGVTIPRDEDETIHAMLKRADELMYAKKQERKRARAESPRR